MFLALALPGQSKKIHEIAEIGKPNLRLYFLVCLCGASTLFAKHVETETGS
jgi:hypothetical protein